MYLSIGNHFYPTSMYARGWIDKKLIPKKFKGTQTAWNKLVEPNFKMATPLISTAFAAKTENPQSAHFTSNMLKSLTGGEILSLTDMHGNGLRLKVM